MEEVYYWQCAVPLEHGERAIKVYGNTSILPLSDNIIIVRNSDYRILGFDII